MAEINIEQIMTEIRKEIEEKGYTEKELSFSDIEMPHDDSLAGGAYDRDVCLRALAAMDNGYMHIFPVPFLEKNPLSLFFKKVIRKLTKFLFYQVVTVQNSFNSNTVSYCMQVSRYMEQMEREMKKKDAQISDMQDEIQELKRRMEQ